MADSYGARTRAGAGCLMLKRASPDKAADILGALGVAVAISAQAAKTTTA